MKRYDVEYRDEEGDNYEESFDTKNEAMDFIHGLRLEDCTIVQTWFYLNDEYKGGFKTR